MARLSGFTILAHVLLGTVLASSALGMTRGIIPLLNLCTPQIIFRKKLRFTKKKKKKKKNNTQLN